MRQLKQPAPPRPHLRLHRQHNLHPLPPDPCLPRLRKSIQPNLLRRRKLLPPNNHATLRPPRRKPHNNIHPRRLARWRRHRLHRPPLRRLRPDHVPTPRHRGPALFPAAACGQLLAVRARPHVPAAGLSDCRLRPPELQCESGAVSAGRGGAGAFDADLYAGVCGARNEGEERR